MTSHEQYVQNREKISEYNRDYYRRNREKVLTQARENHEQNRDRERARGNAWYRDNREKVLEERRAYYKANRDKVLAQGKDYRIRNADVVRARGAQWRHALRPDEWAAMWVAQHGLCYLCGEELSGKVAVDHDHSCCPKNRSCSVCRRGLAHNLCNVSIGFAGDDPQKLRRMADALEAAQLEVGRRRASAGEQLVLEIPA